MQPFSRYVGFLVLATMFNQTTKQHNLGFNQVRWVQSDSCPRVEYQQWSREKRTLFGNDRLGMVYFWHIKSFPPPKKKKKRDIIIKHKSKMATVLFLFDVDDPQLKWD